MKLNRIKTRLVRKSIMDLMECSVTVSVSDPLAVWIGSSVIYSINISALCLIKNSVNASVKLPLQDMLNETKRN